MASFNLVKAGIRKLVEPSSLDRLIARVRQHPEAPPLDRRLRARLIKLIQMDAMLAALFDQNAESQTKLSALVAEHVFQAPESAESSRLAHALMTEFPGALGTPEAFTTIAYSLRQLKADIGDVLVSIRAAPIVDDSAAEDALAAARRGELEITQKLLGEVLDVRPLTRAELSWLLWGKPNSDPAEPGSDRRRTAERLSVVNPDVRHHLDAALRLVPYCDSTSSDVVGPRAKRVGLLSATIRIDVKIRNTGTESSGIRLKRPAEPSILHKYPAESDRAVTYSILDIDETRKDVVPGTPVMVQASLRVQIWFDRWAKYDPFGYVRVARDLADCLSHPIDFVRLTGVLDDGQEVASDLLVKISEQSQRFETEPLDVDELEKHIGAIDAAIRPIPALKILKGQAVNLANLDPPTGYFLVQSVDMRKVPSELG